MIDPKQLRPGEVCRLVNSSPLGEVLTQAKLRVHRNRAGMRIGDAKHVVSAAAVHVWAGVIHCFSVHVLRLYLFLFSDFNR